MTVFRALYTTSTFKAAFGDLLQLSGPNRDRVVAAVRSGPDDESELDDALQLAAAALRTLRDIASDSSVDELLADIDEAGPPNAIEQLGDLTQHLRRTEAEEERTFIRRVERSTLPILAKPRFSVDFRATRWRETDEIKVVPVVVARFEFDETVGGGDSINFQLSIGALKRLKSDIDSAIILLKESVESIGDRLVPADFREQLKPDSDAEPPANPRRPK